MGNGCHKVTEICPGLLLGSLWDVDEMILRGADVLMPLDHCPLAVALTFRGEILLREIPDYGVLEADALQELIDTLTDRLQSGHTVGLFCIGGHGRTGYIASCVMGKMGAEDPIAFVRNRYCKKAVESFSQLCAVAEFTGKPELVERYRYTVYPYNSHDCK